MAREQEQFLDVVDRDTAATRWRAAIGAEVGPAENVALDRALGRVLAEDVLAGVDVPAFDRSNVDGYAVRAADTFGAAEEATRSLVLNPEEIATGTTPRFAVAPGTATPIATGAMVPRGADAVVMVEHARVEGETLVVGRPVAPGAGMAFAGTDMARGELVLRRGTVLTSRETGVLAAIGRDEVAVVRRPRVAILSTGDEIVAPGRPLPPASVYDSNATILADAVRELGGEPIGLGIVDDDEPALAEALRRGLDAADLVILSGGTSKGTGDLSYRVLLRERPGVVVHGVALKPGKPVCLGAVGTKPVAILPGFPTSAIFTFHEFVAPVLRRLAGLPEEPSATIRAVLPDRLDSAVGRTEYALVGLFATEAGPLAYPMGKGSGSVTAFSRADGFIVIPRNREYLDRGEAVEVVPLGRGLGVADLICIGSHCPGLDVLLGSLGDAGLRVKTLWVGSQGGLTAAARGACDIAGLHLLDPASGVYNAPFLPEGVRLLEGYGRMQGLASRRDDARFVGGDAGALVLAAAAEPACLMVNRNRGSGTRVLIDGLLGGLRPDGYANEARSHNAVAAAIAQGRADWGLTIAPIAEAYRLKFVPYRAERFDFAIPESRWDRPAVAAFRAAIEAPEVRARLRAIGFLVDGEATR